MNRFQTFCCSAVHVDLFELSFKKSAHQVSGSVPGTFHFDNSRPFVEARAAVHGFNMNLETGFSKTSSDEYRSTNAVHLDAFRQVLNNLLNFLKIFSMFRLFFE